MRRSRPTWRDEFRPPRICRLDEKRHSIDCYRRQAFDCSWKKRFAIMGRIPVNRPEARRMLETWKDQPGMLGVRLTFHHDWDRPWMTDGTADWFWPTAERLGIPVMLNAPMLHSEIGDIAAQHPGLRIIVECLRWPAQQDGAEPDGI
jgi:predicted TIM-barrel fold metal-dependent hydrolase